MSSYSVPTMRSISTYLLALLALVFLLPTSCKPDSDVEEATLELSPSTLNFTKDGGEQVVTITTNRENWSAFSPQEDAWVKLKEEGSTLRSSSMLEACSVASLSVSQPVRQASRWSKR